ncbi:MAG TPA: polysaccharide pyruvyl transferase family protein [Devosia sp.]|jgi:hypothetical protein|nr:polysaccharide pyruvyl transferase family protein [Devosia sp.]
MTGPLPPTSPTRERIGVLTFHRCINYGSYWQARCLVEGLRGLGYDAVLMDHRSRSIDRAEWRCALAPVWGAENPREEYRRKTRAFLEAFEELPQTAPFPLERPEEAESFGQVVVGSDEVWNLRHPWYGGREMFYGKGLETRLASYAASFGNQNAAEGLSEDWAELLRGFSALAVRDQNSRRIVAEALDEEPELVLDPCLQFADRIPAGDDADEGGYVALYGHSFPHWFSRAVREWADRRGLELLSFGYRNEWAHREWLDAGPEAFPGFIRGASAVVTNFFHGCVFSLVKERPFVCAPSDYRNNKVRDLLDLLGASERLVGEDRLTGLDDLLSRPAGTATYSRIEQLRGTSSRYLDHALQ